MKSLSKLLLALPLLVACGDCAADAAAAENKNATETIQEKVAREFLDNGVYIIDRRHVVWMCYFTRGLGTGDLMNASVATVSCDGAALKLNKVYVK